ncbi:hypothetical protein DMN91_003742 [Ooceraea biroi]|uniref:Heat shock factor 2-binding protein n=1 Tax=Ooceraea biroi TaxID=2015173 RepID=A0A3L8DSY2_OOCBI|nr:heat shock factor 2-binding protein [Ooceraea biroi]RLU23537.1 hypothetical protein DMN91_003742 [Ooceraea biroi]
MEEFNIKNERELLTSLEPILNSTENNLHKFIIPRTFAASNPKCGSCNGETNGQRGDEQSAREITALKSECKELRARVERLTGEKDAAFEEMERLKDQLLSQSTYCASLGAILGNLTWRASRFPQIVDIWLSTFQDKIGEFLSLINGTFEAFVDTYKGAFPPTSNVEYQFMMGLLGIVTNVSASPEGRQFLITNSNGMEFVRKMVKLTPELPLAPGVLPLKKLILMVLYNVSLNKTGLQYLLELHVGDTLSHCLEEDKLSEKKSSEELQLLCLRILQSVTYDLRKPEYIRDLTTKIPIERIKTMMFAPRSDISEVAKQVVRHLRDS